MRSEKTKRLITYSLFGAIIIVLQLIATSVNIGGFPITLTLIPIVIASALYGPKAGGIMGLIFGFIVVIIVVMGGDPNGQVMMSSNPVITTLLCLLKGYLAGLVSGICYAKISNKKVAILISSLAAPIVNTGVFEIGLILFFDMSFTIMISAFISINFLIELLINVLLSQGILRIINNKRKR